MFERILGFCCLWSPPPSVFALLSHSHRPHQLPLNPLCRVILDLCSGGSNRKLEACVSLLWRTDECVMCGVILGGLDSISPSIVGVRSGSDLNSRLVIFREHSYLSSHPHLASQQFKGLVASRFIRASPRESISLRAAEPWFSAGSLFS